MGVGIPEEEVGFPEAGAGFPEVWVGFPKVGTGNTQRERERQPLPANPIHKT